MCRYFCNGYVFDVFLQLNRKQLNRNDCVLKSIKQRRMLNFSPNKCAKQRKVSNNKNERTNAKHHITTTTLMQMKKMSSRMTPLQATTNHHRHNKLRHRRHVPPHHARNAKHHRNQTAFNCLRLSMRRRRRKANTPICWLLPAPPHNLVPTLALATPILISI